MKYPQCEISNRGFKIMYASIADNMSASFLSVKVSVWIVTSGLCTFILGKYGYLLHFVT